MKSIGFKLWRGMMLLVLIVLVLLWLFQIVFLESFYTNMRISDIKKEGISIIKLLKSSDKNLFELKSEEFTIRNNLSIELLDVEGNTIYLSGAAGTSGQMPMMRNNAKTKAYSQVLDGHEVSILTSHPRFGNKFVLIGIPYKIKDKVSGAFFITMPLAVVEDTTSILKRQLIYITLILIIAAVIISYLMSKTFTKPILEIIMVSKKMASGNFDDRIQNKRKDEIGSLAETINFMGQELSKIDQLRKDLVANISHELRTPLSIIRGYAETIRDVNGCILEKRNRQLDIIIEESERLSIIVDDILNLSQLQAGYFTLKKENFLLNETIKNVIHRYDLLVEKNGIKIILKEIGNIMVLADESRIEQVLYNLINNAFNHTEEGGNITIKIIDGKEKAKIEVSDTGSGIPLKDIKYIWDKYYKTEKRSENKIIGTGLGLAIVKNILEAHDSFFGVESSVNKGTTFWFELKKDFKNVFL